ncbi:MAG: ParA family protein [Chloroflexota bacterium]
MIVAVAAQKGGCSKTTTVVNLAAAFAERGSSTLVVDLDAQAHSSLWLLGEAGRHQGPFVQDWLDGAKQSPIHETTWPDLDVIPANLGLNHLRDRLDPAKRAADARRLEDRLRDLSRTYDWIFLDCPAGLNSLTINALVAADALLVPVGPPDPLAVDGMQHIITSMKRIVGSLNPRLRLLGILISNAQLERASQRRSLERMREQGLPILDTIINSSARVGAAAEQFQPIVAHTPRSFVADAYRALSLELEQRVRA